MRNGGRCEVRRFSIQGQIYQQAGAPEAAQYAKDIMPVGLIRGSLPHANVPQREQLRTTLSQLGP